MLDNRSSGGPEGLLREACAQLSRRLRGGEECRAETLFTAFPTLQVDADRAIDLIYTEYVVREELGQKPTAAEYYTRFPQWREYLERQFRIHELVGDEAAPAAPGGAVSTVVHESAGGGNGSDPGPWLDEYERLEEIGRGAKGVVYKARQAGLNRVVALKMVLAGAHASADELARFRREAEGLARLRHPNVVQVYAVGDEDGLPFFSMEYAEGGSLARRIGGKPQPARQAAAWMEAVARGVHHAHEQKLIHRDLKPGNVVLTADGVPKVMDFGLAKWLEKTTGTTQDGDIRGTPSYMAPEQAAGRLDQIGPRTDVYGLGAILYELLTGQAPFRARSRIDVLKQIQERDPPRPRAVNRAVDAELEAVCLKCLEKKPAERYAGAEELADDLARWLRGEPTVARPRGWAARTVRWLRRHPFTSAATLLFGAATIATPFTVQCLDPDRPLKLITRDLAQGKSVSLVGEPGRRPWYRLLTEDSLAKVSESPDGSLSVHSMQLGLLELVPDPQNQRYRFSIEVRQDWAAADSAAVGLYLMHSRHTDGLGRAVHCFHRVTFGERYVTGPRVAQARRAQIATQFFSHFEANPRSHLLLHGSLVIPARDVSRPDHWRCLAAEVTPEGMRAYWASDKSADGWDFQLIGTLAGSRVAEALAARPGVPPPDPMQDVPAAFSGREGLGLVVDKARATFRRAALEPVTNGI
jgi:serine/threonine protein kinase